MSWVVFLIGVLAVVASGLPVLLARRFLRDIREDLGRNPDRGYRPRVTLIVPCKGLDPDFNVNIRAFFAQDYPDLELILVTATRDDPAHEALEKMIHAHPQVRARLLVAGIATGRGQKINNQLKAVAEVEADTDVLVFMDSDARPKPAFVRHLVQPLENKQTGLATGFRWYMPVTGGLWSVLRSAWNGGGVVFLTDPQANYAWGGAMAIRKETFETCRVADRWQNALSDDMTITNAVRSRGLGIRFVPHCLVTTHEDCTFAQMLEWTNRQTIIAKVYHPALWWKIALAHCVGNVILLLGMVLLLGYLLDWIADPLILLSSLLMLAIIPMEMLNGLVLLPAVLAMLPEHRRKLVRLFPAYCLLAPLASILALVNTISSFFTNRITWRGVTYEMRSPTETIVIQEQS
ncbi:glycosyltransferase [Desulfonatronum thioautotrophicum]|uniref:glycosyltransferase n=1 Tax=Desulfonatronum thioautotrophicum TaxID=617001 RepID=UPI0005EB525D|nr:glycosyltransferase [Desulfonatronum thioautotrophicum]